jgi:V8-like Glu-specific endopeptidase
MRIETFDPQRSDLTAGQTSWTRSLPRAVRQTRSVRLDVRVVEAGQNGTWSLRVKDASGALLETLAQDSPLVAAGHFWTRDIPGSQAELELSWDGSGTPPVIEVARYAYWVGAAYPQSIYGPDQRIKILDANPMFRDWGRPIARLAIMMGYGQSFCTGFLVANNLILTNEHCVRTPEEARSMIAEFGYDSAGAQTERFRGLALRAGDAALDYALVEVEGRPADRFGRVSLAGRQPADDRQQLAIIQHPAGQTKQLSLDDCLVDGLARSGVTYRPTDFGHTCDTLGGSSGSPVFDRESGRLLGLHHFGFHANSADPVNQAVDLPQILADLQTKLDDSTYSEIIAP